MKKGDADIIVQPMFEVESTNSITTARVSGYAGKYREFRDITVADTLAFNVRSSASTMAAVAAPEEVGGTKKSQGMVILGVVLLVGLLALLVI